MSQKNNLNLCLGHKQEWKQSHYAEHNCDYCRLEKECENLREHYHSVSGMFELAKQQRDDLLAAADKVANGRQKTAAEVREALLELREAIDMVRGQSC